MTTIRLATCALGAIMFAAVPSYAQTPAAPTPAAPPPLAAAPSASHSGEWRISKIVGLSVFNADNDTLGTVNDVLTDKTGKVTAIVIGVGGFLGVGEHLVAVPFDAVKFVMEPLARRSGDEPIAATPNDAVKGDKATVSKGSAEAEQARLARVEGAKAVAKSTEAASHGGSAHDAATPGVDPWAPNHAVLNATKDQLKAMTEFKYKG